MNIFNPIKTEKINARTNLKVTWEFFVQYLQEIFSICFGISFSNALALSNTSMTQNRYDQILICSPPCKRKKRREKIAYKNLRRKPKTMLCNLPIKLKSSQSNHSKQGSRDNILSWVELRVYLMIHQLHIVKVDSKVRLTFDLSIK